MSAAFVATCQSTGIDASTTTTGSMDSTLANFIAIEVSDYAAAGIGTLTDTYGNTWHPCSIYTDGSLCRVRIYYAINPTVGSGHTFTYSGVTPYAALVVVSYSGMDITAPFDAENGASSLSTGNITPGSAGEVIIAALCNNDAGSPTYSVSGGSLAIRGQVTKTINNFGAALADEIQTSATVVGATFAGTATASESTIASFKAAGGGKLFQTCTLSGLQTGGTLFTNPLG
jgi:hypothetical protein